MLGFDSLVGEDNGVEASSSESVKESTLGEEAHSSCGKQVGLFTNNGQVGPQIAAGALDLFNRWAFSQA